MRSRALVLFLLGSFLAAGCGSRGVAAGVLGVAAVLAGAGAVGAATISTDKEKKLADDVAKGGLTGRQYADRDSEGKRWNRTARGAAFVSGLALVGLVLVWESSLAASSQYGPAEQPRGGRLIPGVSPAPTPTSAALHPAGISTAQRSASAR